MTVGNWFRSRWVRVLWGVIVGAAAGIATYYGTQLSGPALFIACGALAGLLAAVVVRGLNQSVRLTNITVSVPHFSQLHFAVTKDSQQVAWKLFVESVTRISTQPLDTSGGLIREALTSLYSLFAITRDILKGTQPSRLTGSDPTVEHLAIAMLNAELRPFLTRWHPRLRAWEQAHSGDESGWPENTQCRAEMAAMQQRLVTYVLAFGKLARLPNSRQIVNGTLGNQFNQTAVPTQQLAEDQTTAG